MSSEEEPDFGYSVLGTKQYWDEFFSKELSNYEQNIKEDDTWFGKESITRVISFFENQKINKDSNVLDIGCGNGTILLKLSALGYKNLYGIDYAEAAVKLANIFAKENGKKIKYEARDFLTPIEDFPLFSISLLTFNIAMDKGTFDAICLNPVSRGEKIKRYKRNLRKILNPGGLFIITSCNWTKEELISQFEKDFSLLDQLPTLAFNFGGKTGLRETALVFKKFINEK